MLFLTWSTRSSSKVFDDDLEAFLASLNYLVLPLVEEEEAHRPLPQSTSNESDFAKFAAQSLKRRGSRKLLRFPSLRRVYAKPKLSSDGIILKAGRSYGKDIHHYLVAWGFRIRNDLHAAGMHSPSPEALEEIFLTTVWAKARTWDPMDGRGPGLRDSVAQATVEHAVETVCTEWDPAVIEDARKRGMRGGRPVGSTKFTVGMLAGFEGMSISGQAEALGCSTATISNLRRSARSD